MQHLHDQHAAAAAEREFAREELIEDVAAAITTSGMLLACLAPLVIAWLCLRLASELTVAEPVKLTA